MRYSLDTPMRLNGHSTRCEWCANLLSARTRIWKVQDHHRYYCSELCFLQGEERRLRYTAALAGKVHSPWYIVLAIIIAFMMGAFSFSSKARAHDPTTHQANDLSTARSKSGGQCCDGNDYAIPYTWERTDTGYRIHFKGQWVDIPKDAEVNNMRNPDGEAKAWIVFDEMGAPFVRCFMPGMEG